MEVFDAVRTVLAVRKYQDKPIPLDVVRRIVEAGRFDGKQYERPALAFHCGPEPQHTAATRCSGENRALYRAGGPSDCRRDSADDIFSIRCQPCDSIDDVDRMVGRDRFELGGLSGIDRP